MDNTHASICVHTLLATHYTIGEKTKSKVNTHARLHVLTHTHTQGLKHEKHLTIQSKAFMAIKQFFIPSTANETFMWCRLTIYVFLVFQGRETITIIISHLLPNIISKLFEKSIGRTLDLHFGFLLGRVV